MTIGFNSINEWRPSWHTDWLRPCVTWSDRKRFTGELQKRLMSNFSLLMDCENRLHAKVWLNGDIAFLGGFVWR